MPGSSGKKPTDAPSIAVLGSVNLDIVASAPRMPVPGETVTGATLNRYPGGKGANQALAARRLGAEVILCARVGRDPEADDALALLRAEGVELTRCETDSAAPTGIALIVVAPSGENQIVVAPGANAAFTPDKLDLPQADALICQLEIPLDTIAKAAESFEGFLSLNLAPAKAVSKHILRRADLIVMNETEAAFVGDALAAHEGLTVITYGRQGAVLKRDGKEIARATPPQVQAVDTTGAGDAFTAALTIGLVSGEAPQRALHFACAVGACTATRHGAQPSFPRRDEVDALLLRED
ncbi:MAG: ribokinase [Gammaproteobacteria bacterium]|nr:ribokinase [Gammaproteobacteria bacterium]